ncbi:LacI family DNA-binding transcriptional regulator [Neobacillus sp. YIM B06451]|uniref:LacI family DNA-binding transcriptional regulator n=1 Tax=Neobacillus sp. YIM B06451 TaxID=3070994 RepID=UPI00292ED52B|nr:LacI family DNA-binding transcriptional regulator [Neobacillus sp. YIM B06451]
MVSIKDIAKRAGVSISTVSYALNGSTKVTEETRARIMALAEELDYIPNAAARNLKKQETKIIGAYLTDYSGAFYGHLLHGMREKLSKSGYELIVCTGTQSHRFLPERMIDGAIILDASFQDAELLSYAERGHKLVVLDRELMHDNIRQVLLDNQAGAGIAVHTLLDAGLDKLYFVTGPKESYDSTRRLEAARAAVKDNPNVAYTEIQGHFDKESGMAAAEKITKEYSGPVGVFCFNDEMAIGMFNFLSNTEFIIGKDIHIIGFDNIEISHYIDPRLTTIAYSKKKWGAMAAGALLDLIKGESEPNGPMKIQVSLLEGRSVRAVSK